VNAVQTTPSDRTSVDRTDHIRAQWQARSIAAEAHARQRRSRRILLVLCCALAALGPSILAAAIGVRAGEAVRILLLTVVPVALACVLLRPR